MRAFWLNRGVLEALRTELLGALSGARVQQVKQAAPRTVVVELHLHGTTAPLVLQADGPVALSLRSEVPRRAEQTPPAFQGLLRKHLANTRLSELVVDVEHARVAVVFATLSTPLQLVLDWARGAANVLLVHENGTVMGAADPTQLKARGLRVGQKYAPVPSTPADAEVPAIEAARIAAHSLAAFPTHALVEMMLGGGEAPREKVVISPWRKRLKSELDKAARLVRALESDVEKSAGAAPLRSAAELAKRMMHELPRGVPEWTLKDPWVESDEIRVQVDPAISPHENVEKLFHRARRMDRTRAMVEPRLVEARAKVDEIRALMASLDAAPDDEGVLQRVRALLGEERAPVAKKGPQARQPFRAFRTRDGFRVLVGKTSVENDLLTHRTARGNDIFLHARDAHGSHVILVMEKPGAPPDVALGQAAQLAAHFSEARKEAVVDVRWTEVKHLRKVPGRVGMVTLAKERVKRVRLDDPALKELLAHEEGASTRLGA